MGKLRTRIGGTVAATIAATLLASCAAPGQSAPAAPPGGSAPVGAAGQPTPSLRTAASTNTSPSASSPPVSTTAVASASPQAAAATSSAASSPGRWTFDADAAGGLPQGAQSFSGQWAVRPEPDAPSPPNALCQTGQAEFPAISLDNRPLTDLTMTTRFKPISGREDQAGGLIFRIQDKDNYYIARGNPLEDNLIFFIYQNARRSQLKSASAKAAAGQWHELRVDVRGPAFVAYLNGQRVMDVSDDRHRSGGVGLWTKADSVTCFDDVQVTTA